jgi:hypothetical protein
MPWVSGSCQVLQPLQLYLHLLLVVLLLLGLLLFAVVTIRCALATGWLDGVFVSNCREVGTRGFRDFRVLLTTIETLAAARVVPADFGRALSCVFNPTLDDITRQVT